MKFSGNDGRICYNGKEIAELDHLEFEMDLLHQDELLSVEFQCIKCKEYTEQQCYICGTHICRNCAVYDWNGVECWDC